VGNTLSIEPLAEFGASQHARRRKLQAGPGHQRHYYFPDARVEAGGGKLQHAAVAPDGKARDLGL